MKCMASTVGRKYPKSGWWNYNIKFEVEKKMALLKDMFWKKEK